MCLVGLLLIILPNQKVYLGPEIFFVTAFVHHVISLLYSRRNVVVFLCSLVSYQVFNLAPVQYGNDVKTGIYWNLFHLPEYLKLSGNRLVQLPGTLGFFISEKYNRNGSPSELGCFCSP